MNYTKLTCRKVIAITTFLYNAGKKTESKASIHIKWNRTSYEESCKSHVVSLNENALLQARM
jgi:hypothetical protein